ncbi:hypothetical protein SAMN06265222_11073 [Neorhodopirellula lusitana]|uniref:Uncharacterized protein n=1 Tax=Neorhodopirellula lusitana TaxID=445327 RepID=A0ABY1QCW1_9BACT|nr:hypothetical protein [Neorhodopirellula lusitana]SMP66975.1 hypothetical protein SAMN06265222_11073 [Neorhodopirellula lusitana]
MKTKLCLAITMTVLAFTSVGCGSSAPPKPTDEQNAFASVEGLGDMAGDDASFAKAFVAGAVPKNRKDYSERGYEVVGEATFNGDTVTVPVKIFGGVHSTGGNERAGASTSTATETEKVWTLIRIEDKWKLKDAPLS